MSNDPVGRARCLLTSHPTAAAFSAALAKEGVPHRSFERRRTLQTAEGKRTEVITQVDVAGVVVASFREYI